MILKSIGLRTLFLFVIGFILTLPFPYFFFPNWGNWFQPVVIQLGKIVFGNEDLVFYSDSKLMLIWILFIGILSVFLALIWTIIQRKQYDFLHFWFYRIVTYYLSLSLLIYGFNKLFKYQFYFPEPNTLFTPLGQLSPDILYWSSMGTSHSYSIFAGLIEIIPALLLLFRRTRLLGAFIALSVLVNVFFINWGFHITVKTYTAFLLLLTCIVLQPHFKRLYTVFFTRNPLENVTNPPEPQHRFYIRFYPILKTLILALMLLEVASPYVQSGYLNGDNQPKPKMYGAYEVDSNLEGVKRVFFHTDPYFILQTETDQFIDFQLKWNDTNLELTNYADQKATLSLIVLKDDHYQLLGDFFGKDVSWLLRKIDLNLLPIYGE